MQGFDIESLLRFTPPQFLCERCHALLTNVPENFAYRCPICAVTYMPTPEYPSCSHYFRARGLEIKFSNAITHSQKLAMIARRARASLSGQVTDYPPLRALLEALNGAENFVHFTTFGISAVLIGAIKLAAQRIDVRGIVSGVKRDEMYRELTAFADDAPRLQTRLFAQDSQWFPHQKIIVVDGLLAFKGSANLTDFGWRKAAQGREVIEVITDVREIQDLHNRFFSPVWAGFEGEQPTEPILMASNYGQV
jgi:phosphatidylserine/phosphatidylglycerophosphate/cardiolipin synthase-like enzyme